MTIWIYLYYTSSGPDLFHQQAWRTVEGAKRAADEDWVLCHTEKENDEVTPLKWRTDELGYYRAETIDDGCYIVYPIELVD